MDKGDFYSGPFKLLLIISQCLALLPISLAGKSPGELKFEWKCSLVVYNLIVASSFCVLLVADAAYYFERGLKSTDIHLLVSKVFGISVLLLSIKLASKWPKICKQWTQVDSAMNRRFGNLQSLNCRIKIFLCLYLVMVIVGYIVPLTQGSPKYYSSVLYYLPYNVVIVALLLIAFTIQHFMIHFHDLLLIALSMTLAMRFKQIRDQLELNQKNRFRGTTDYWFELRKDYDRLTHLCKKLDDGINGLILVNLAYNLFIVIYFLFHQLTSEETSAASIIYNCLFFFLVFKVFALCLYTSWVNDESLAPVNILNSVSSRDYNPEIGRWLTQMSFDDVALTGGKIFKITRSIFLDVVSIVVTYELVAMQFHGFSSKV